MTDLGVSKSRGLTIYFALAQVHTLTFYSREGGPLGQTPISIAKQVSDTRQHDPRRFVLIVEGEYDYLCRYHQAEIDVDVRIFVGNAADLSRLKLSVIDADWDDSQAQLNINDYIRHIF
jgi:hypothetical protein